MGLHYRKGILVSPLSIKQQIDCYYEAMHCQFKFYELCADSITLYIIWIALISESSQPIVKSINVSVCTL